MKVYRTDSYSIKIEEREILRMTDKSIFWINSRGKEDRELKVSSWNVWHNSREEAISFLRESILKKIEIAERNLIEYKSDLEKLG